MSRTSQAPSRAVAPDSVYALVKRLRRDLAGIVPAAWTPHWLRHSHATALLLTGVPVHVVSRGWDTRMCRPRWRHTRM